MDVLSERREEIIAEAMFIIDKNATVREAEKVFGVSRSTISRDISIRLEKIDSTLAVRARTILEKNKRESRERANNARSLKAKKKK